MRAHARTGGSDRAELHEVRGIGPPTAALLADHGLGSVKKLARANFRDLGGYVTRDGRQVRWGRIFRSDALGKLTDPDITYLEHLGMHLVCDFRDDHETERAPSRVPNHPDLRIERFPIGAGGDTNELTGGRKEGLTDMVLAGSLGEVTPDLLGDFYVGMIESRTEPLVSVLERVADPANHDCLYLNVFTPAGSAAGSDLPVMVDLHPGGTGLGSPYREADRLVGRGAVVITVASRLGLFGYMGHPQLSAEGGGTSGEYGVRDQIKALRWVQRNVEAFGGDRDNVTLMGSSAGSIDAAVIAVSPLARGLVDRAIVQTMYSPTLADGFDISIAEEDGVAAAELVGCADAPDQLACLRSAPAEDLVAALAELGYFYDPWVGGRVLPDQVLNLLQEDPSPVPLLLGGDAEEAASQFFPDLVLGEIPDAAQYRRDRTDELVGPDQGRVVRRRYPLRNYESATWALVDTFTDAVYQCPERQMGLSSNGPVWRYLYDHTFRNDDELAEFRAGHIFEDFLLWGDRGYVPTGAEDRFADQLAGYWTNFAKRGDPNGAGLPTWPTYRPGRERVLVLDAPLRHTVDRYHTENCEFWEGQGLFPEAATPEARSSTPGA